MFYPDFKEFKKKAKEGNLIPVYREILADLETPLSAFLKLRGRTGFLLESVEGGEKWARYSFIGSNPSMIIEGKGGRVTVKKGGHRKRVGFKNDPLEVVSAELKRYRPVVTPGLPRFYGGFIGYIGYDLVRHFERLPDMTHKGINIPDLYMMFTDTLIVFDNLSQTMKVISNAYVEGNPSDAYKKACKKINNIVRKLKTKTIEPRLHSARPSSIISNFTKAGFLNAVRKAKRYISAGDIIQVVLSQNFQRRTTIHPINAYRALRVINPSPYMFYIETGKCRIAGSSPEILVRLEDDIIELRPIAGTRRRGETPEEDLHLERELRADPKEIAEHIMLVDLGRNDIGRVAEIGTVKVTELMTVERYSHVMHLVSNVVGRLENSRDAFDLLKASFPAGTVTGAPKIRAMEIIEELEPTKRGPYAGCVGYFGFSGNMDMCITIRTIIFKGKTAYVQAGAGIVADSDPKREYTETVNKAKGMMKAIDMVEKGFYG
jgi:anthranilate synthase component 1